MKFLFFDYDGTLTHNGVISEKNRYALLRAKEQGHKILLNTGRSKGNMPDHVLREIPWDGMIAGGGYMEYEGKVLFEKLLSADLMERGLAYSKERGVRVLYEGVENTYSNHPNEWLKDIREHLPFSADMRITNMTISAKLAPEDRELFSDARVCELPTYFEVCCKGVSKDTGLRFIEENLSVPHEDIIVFGDSENDIDMLKYAHTAVIMNHAPKELDEYATLRTESDKDGVAEGLAKLLNI